MKHDTERRKKGNEYDRKIGKDVSIGNIDSWQGQASQVKVTVRMKVTMKVEREEGRITGLRNQSLK